MTGVGLPDETEVTYTYNVLGQRVTKSVGGVVAEKYLWGGVNTQLLAVLDGENAVVARFEYAGGRMPVAMVQGGDVYYLAYDQVGSLRAVYTALGAVVRTVEYDAWGNILSESAAQDYEGLKVPFGFAGGLHDRDTGLVLFGLRNYDPETGRWTSRDPIGLAGGDTDLYAYCANDPVGKTDSTGLQCDIKISNTGINDGNAFIEDFYIPRMTTNQPGDSHLALWGFNPFHVICDGLGREPTDIAFHYPRTQWSYNSSIYRADEMGNIAAGDYTCRQYTLLGAILCCVIAEVGTNYPLRKGLNSAGEELCKAVDSPFPPEFHLGGAIVEVLATIPDAVSDAIGSFRANIIGMWGAPSFFFD